MPVAGASFEAVFSKDALLLVADKAAINREVFREVFRVLRPGGLLVISGWLRGPGHDAQTLVDECIAAAGHDFLMVTLPQTTAWVTEAGLSAIQTQDRSNCYITEARCALDRLTWPMGAGFATEFGAMALADEISF